MTSDLGRIGSLILHDGMRERILDRIERMSRPDQGRYAALCAERVLRFTDDPRAAAAIAAARAWADGRIRPGVARAAALEAHAAARAASSAAVFACRAAGHAAATAHVWRHAIGPCDYALKALATVSVDPEAAIREERRWQLDLARTMSAPMP
ncbi:MAG: putative immunity protein [Candidatus Izemoplasmatales bacterium]